MKKKKLNAHTQRKTKKINIRAEYQKKMQKKKKIKAHTKFKIKNE